MTQVHMTQHPNCATGFDFLVTFCLKNVSLKTKLTKIVLRVRIISNIIISSNVTTDNTDYIIFIIITSSSRSSKSLNDCVYSTQRKIYGISTLLRCSL